MDVIARLPDCDGRAADAVSAYTQVTLEDAPRLLKIPKSECPHGWIRLPRHKWPKSRANMKTPWYFSNDFIRTFFEQDCCGKDNSMKFCWNLDGKKYLRMSVCSSKTRIILTGIRGRLKKRLAKSRIWLPCGRNCFKKKVYLDEPSSFS